VVILPTSDSLKVAIAQIAPVWFDREKTLAKVCDYTEKAVSEGCQLVIFGEAFIPGYPFWIERTDGAHFNSKVQKEIYSSYLDQGVQIQKGDLQPLCDIAKQGGIAVYVGCMERAEDRGGHSLYCTLIYIDANGVIGSIHRKLMPTYEERLAWAPGDAHGLRVHSLGAFTVGGLNCWENWMPLARTTLYGLGEDLHVSVWPGSNDLTQDITRFIALESRSYVISASGLMRKTDLPKQMPHFEKMLENSTDILANGGSCIAAPDGIWLVAPVENEEKLIVATLEHQKVREERQNFDAAGHYSRADVLQLVVNRKRQSILQIHED
jgi:nitrilase